MGVTAFVSASPDINPSPAPTSPANTQTPTSGPPGQTTVKPAVAAKARAPASKDDLQAKVAGAQARVDRALEQYQAAKIGAAQLGKAYASNVTIDDPGPRLQKAAATVSKGAAMAQAGPEAGDLAKAAKIADAIDGAAKEAAQVGDGLCRRRRDRGGNREDR
jgi:hypothetical protein